MLTAISERVKENSLVLVFSQFFIAGSAKAVLFGVAVFNIVHSFVIIHPPGCRVKRIAE